MYENNSMEFKNKSCEVQQTLLPNFKAAASSSEQRNGTERNGAWELHKFTQEKNSKHQMVYFIARTRKKN